jgi:hypothetical protein
LNPLDFFIWSVLQAKIQGSPHANLAALSRSIETEWDMAKYIRKTGRSFRRCR